MTDPDILQRFRIVLWRPKSPGNVGSVARAMKNMGFSRLILAEFASDTREARGGI